ncbi:MAG: PPC domain-containing protein [Chloroflexota bacterium]
MNNRNRRSRYQRDNRYRSCTILLMVCIWSLLATITSRPLHAQSTPPTITAATDDAAASSTAKPILLGEYVFQQFQRDETATFAINIPETGTYLITADDPSQAIAFDLIVSSVDGDYQFRDLFQTAEFVFEAGDYTLEFIAVDHALLSFVVLGLLGEMSDDVEKPGQLYSGGVYTDRETALNRQTDRYATLTIPPSDYYQEVNLVVETPFGIDGVAYHLVVTDTHTTHILTTTPMTPANILTFWTRGGTYPVVISPVPATPNRKSDDAMSNSMFNSEPNLDPNLDSLISRFTLIPFLSGVLPQLQKETQTIGELVELDDSRYYQMTVDKAGAMVTVALNTQTRQADFDLFIGMTPDEPLWSNTNPGSRETVHFVAPKAGDYYVWVVNQGSSAGNTRLARQGRLTLTLSEDQTTPSLPVNERMWGHVISGERTVHRLHVDEPDQLLTVILLGSDGTDLDLEIRRYDDQGQIAYHQRSMGDTSTEMISLVMPRSGDYEVTITNNRFEDSDYFVYVRTEEAIQQAGQWAVEAQASSEFSETNGAAYQATGAPDTPNVGDYPTAWIPATPNAGLETLELTYAYAVVPYEVHIYETFNSGTIIEIQALDTRQNVMQNPTLDRWVTLWAVSDEDEDEDEDVTDSVDANVPISRTVAAPKVFQPPLKPVSFATKHIRLVIDTSRVKNYNEIDAVELIGRP